MLDACNILHSFRICDLRKYDPQLIQLTASRMDKRQFFFIVILVIMTCVPAGAVDFPYRKDYPDVPVVELAELKAGYDDGSFVPVDVRSTLEYDVIHIKDAHHISLSQVDFAEQLRSLVGRHPGRKVAVYCNGITCLKSYKAAKAAYDGGMSNVYAFDAGIQAWANAFPEQTLLLGKIIRDPQKQLISERELQAKMLSYEIFMRKAAGAGPAAVAIDVRDPFQRTQRVPGLEKALPIPMDKMIKNVIARGLLKDKQLFIFDQVGKQVRWLMYYLVDQGYVDFYFLEGGATSVLKEQQYR